MEGSKAAVRVNRRSESTGRNIWRPPWGSLKKGPTHNRVENLYQRYEEYKAGTSAATGVMPPGGDNVTTQQILETMRALQVEVAASRVEIAASRADNEELHRANEELRRDFATSRGARDGRMCPTCTTQGTSHVVLTGEHGYSITNHVFGPKGHLHRSRGSRGPSHGVPHSDDAYRRI